MAIARDPVLEELKRSISASASLNHSTLSLEGLQQSDIDTVVNKKWRLDEVIGPLRSKLAILSGGRDRRGAPIITITGTEHSDLRPTNVGRLLSYLSKVADESLQGLGFTVVLDMREASWHITKRALKSLQLTFVEHIYQVFVVKPKAFWQRQRVGMTFTLSRSKFHFPVVMLEHSADIFNYLQVSQLTRELGGTLSYNHDRWIDTQRTLEKHLLDLLRRLDDFELLREQLEVNENPENLNEARDAVRRHVEAKQRLDKSDLDSVCEAINNTIVKLFPCTNGDFLACFTRLEELCNTLQLMRDRLERMWTEKGGRLDQILQLRVYENDTEQILRWIHEETLSLSHDHTDVGDSLSTSELSKQSFEDYRTKMAMKHQETSRVLQMGDRLIASFHYASDMIRARNVELRGRWEGISKLCEERLSLLSLSVVFHDKQQKFFQRVEGWVDECMVKHFPTDIPRAEELLQTHQQLKETYQEMYTIVRRDGHRMIDIMRKPVGESSLPLNFIVGARHVKEILETLYDEKSWVDEQWGRRHMVLRQALNLRKFQEDAKKVHLWIADKGNAFLSGGNTIGDDTAATQGLLKKHDIFEAETEKIYLLSNQLFSRAKELSSSGECEEGMIEAERKSLEETVHTFAAQLDERREIIVHSFEYYQSVDALSSELKKLGRPVPREKFSGYSSDIEPRLEEFQSLRSKVNKMAGDAFNCCERLVGRLGNAMATAKEAGTSVNYSAALESVQRKLDALRSEKERLDKLCDQREERWSLCIQLHQFRKDVQKHQGEAEAWSCEQERTEWEPTENPMDAQLELETFQRQYDLLSTSHNELVARGRSVAKQTDQLDLQLFGGHTGSSSPHPAVTTVEDLIGRMEASQKRVDGVAVPRLRQLRDYLQCHLLHQRAGKLTNALSVLSTSLSHVVGVGDSLETAKTLQFRVIEANQKLKAIGQDVESFCQEVEDCLQRQHYESSSLAVLARNLQEKFGAVSRITSEKLHIIRSSVEFHCNINNLSASMELCQRQFSSKDTGQTVADSTTLLKTLENLRTSVEGAAEEVQSQGRNLLERMAAASQSVQKAPVMKTSSEPVFKRDAGDAIPGKDRNRSIDVGEINKTRSSDLGHKGIYDTLESAAATFAIPEDSEASFDSPDSPKLLVAPRRARPGAAAVKPSSNFTALVPSAREEQVIEKLLQRMETQLQLVRQMYQGRQNRLERSRKVIEFKEGVPQVMEWIDTVGSKYLKVAYKFGRSIEEVTALIEKHKHFEQSEVENIANRVEGLKARYSSVEASGHSELNELRGMAASLERQWNKFSKEMTSLSTKLDLSLKFQETLFQASNWCQKSQQFLDSMEEKKESCDTSAEAAKLVTELSLYLSATKNEQEERVLTVKEIGNFLHSNLLVDLSNQIEQSTERTIRDFEQSQGELERHRAKLAQIENEKDREKRLHKKREWVLEELLQTEEAYVSDLKLIVEKCRPRFVSDLLPNSLKGKEGIIFSNVHEIEKFHRGYLLPKLREGQGDIDGTARILMESVDKMAAIYVPYCTDKTASEELLASHRTYLFRVQSMFGTDTPLSTLLIKPVQRITKYPLLLRDALKYTTELGLPTHTLQEALEAVEKIPVATNNAIHLSLLQNYKEVVAELGTLLCQGPLLVSEPKFKIKVEKERQVFVFQSALLFARKVEFQGQAKFKYECKAKIPITSVLQVNEFQEGEPCKFIIASTDQKLHFKASTIESKQLWVRALRTAILERRKGSIGQSLAHIGTSLLSVEGWSKDLMEPSPRPSPRPSPSSSPQFSRRMNGGTVAEVAESPLPSEFERYQVKEDFHPTPLSPPPNTPLSLTRGDIVEVLDSSINRKWYVRTVGGSKVEHGWIPSEILEHTAGEEEPDLGGRRTAKGWVQITAGPSNSSFDEEKIKHLKNQKSFGSHDLQSQQVIGMLKRMTFGPTDEELAQGEEDEVTSLDRPVETVEAQKQGDLHSSASLPHLSPRTSPLPPRRSYTETSILPDTSHNAVNGGGQEEVKPKQRWRRKGVIRKRSQGGRSVSVSSESPSDKMLHSSSLSQLHSSSSDEAISTTASIQDTARTSAEITEEEMERVRKAQEKLKYIMTELVETEREYVQRLEECITGYMKETQSPNLPDTLKGKEKLIFGNIQAVYEFHHGSFLDLLEGAKGSLEDIAKCFLDQAHNFEVYVTYCENKPKSESFLWTFHHNGGTFFEDVQNLLGHRQGIDSFLIKPVQRITKYQLLLRDLHRSAQKAAMETPNLEKALHLMQDVPKRANDAMTLSMIYGYEGNIHASGQIILQDEFTVFERSRWTGAKRHIFLLEQRLVITKEKGDDGMYMYKDSLKIHNLALAEKEGDSPLRFAVGTGQIGLWDQFYILDAGTAEKKQLWLTTIKDILKQQFELLKALKQPKPRSRTLGSEPSDPKSSVAMINLSDDSEDEESLETYSAAATPWVPKDSTSRRRAMTLDSVTTFGEPTPSTPSLKSRPLNLYIVAEDCAPPKENEGILFIHKGQVYDVIDGASDWWLARLVRDVPSSPGDTQLGQKGWVSGSFLDKFDGELSMEEEAALNAAIRRRQLLKQSPIHSASDSPKHRKKSVPKKIQHKVRITNSYTFEENSDIDEEDDEQSAFMPTESSGQAPTIVSHISDETVIAENVVQLHCQIEEGATPTPSVEWTHNWKPLNIDRAFTSFGGESCVLRIKSVQASDEGTYTCTIWNKHGVAASTARLTVLSPPDPPGKPIVKPLTCTSVSLSWELPASDGHSPIKLYIVECKDSVSNRWSTLMKRITEPSFIVDDLMPGIEYLFRVVASNQIGSSKPSTESDRTKMAQTSMESDFLQEPFENRYQLMEEISRGHYGTVYECIHNATQQTYAAKLIPLEVGKEHAKHELDILGRLSHPNIIQVTSAYVTQSHFVILFPLISGVNVFEYFVHHDCLNEDTASGCVEQVLAALCYLHNSNIAHLDIRPENVMMMELAGSTVPEVTLIHMERSRELPHNSHVIVKKMDSCIEYEAPEILRGEPVTTVSDMWSLGVLLYILLGGTSPFLVDSLDLTKDNILSVRYSFPVKHFREVSNSAKDLISKMIVKNKSNRISSTQCLRHPWLTSKSPKHSPNLSTTRLKSYVSSRKWQHTLAMGSGDNLVA